MRTIKTRQTPIALPEESMQSNDMFELQEEESPPSRQPYVTRTLGDEHDRQPVRVVQIEWHQERKQ